MLCSVALLASTSGCRADPVRPGDASPSDRSSATVPGPTTAQVPSTQENKVATRKFAGWLLHAVPMPAKAHEWKHSPNSHFRKQSLWIGPSDNAFARTTWWTVPLSSAEFEAWLRKHAPKDLTGEEGGSGIVQSTGVWEHDYDFTGTSTAAHSAGVVNFAYMPDGGGVAVRVDTFTAARFARTVLVPDDVTSVTIEHTSTSFKPKAKPHTATRTITDPTGIADLVEMVNGLPGELTVPTYFHCPMMPGVNSYRLTFTAPAGTFVADLEIGCGSTVNLTRDGAKTAPHLDPGQAFVPTIRRYLK
jgi:hypothetical protein